MRDFVKFLDISYASASELEYHQLLARDGSGSGPANAMRAGVVAKGS
ncbi:MAG: hypothetical protein WBQ26_06735 [Gemmatimonadaceae bacterium]|nr:hypothetical protein [Gemmatimonadaceae bacterium]